MSRRGSTIERVTAALAVLALVTGCGGTGADDAVSSSTTTASSSTTAPATTAAAPAPEWVAHDGGADCECADGSPYTFFSRADDPRRVVLYFQGGGACFSAETCAFDSGTYDTTVGPGDDPGQLSGIFDFADERNPLRGWSMVFVPYCTGDLHLGDTTHQYGPDLTVQHKGFVNASAGLQFLLDRFPDADEVVVAGSSAGGVPAPLFGGLVADALPDADVAVLADASGGYPSTPETNGAIGALWGTDVALPDWPELTAADGAFGIPDLFFLAGRHAPRIRMARYDAAYDEIQQAFSSLAGIDDATVLAVLDQNEQLVEAQGVDLSVYVAPGRVHTILARPALYTLAVDGTPFVDWLRTLVDGGVPGDVHCTDCGEAADPSGAG